MSKNENQKKKILYLLEYFRWNTDENHGVTMEQILADLENKGIKAERKSIYSDINYLSDAGYEIKKEKKKRNTYYYLIDRELELSQVKILVDAVNSFKFISDKNSKDIISKLEKLVSRYQASALNRQTYVADRVKSTNKTIFYNIEAIHDAIKNNRQISFNYYEWNTKKEKTFRYGKKKYLVSPYSLILSDGNYYLVAFEDKIKHYRVDKMENVEIVDNDRTGGEEYDKIDMKNYSSGVFGMFGNDFTHVDLLFSNDLANVVIDRFGHDITITPSGNDHFLITVRVAATQQFFGWLFALGDKAKIIGPEDIKNKYINYIKSVADLYRNEESSGN